MTRLIDADELKNKVKAMVEHNARESDYDFGCNQTLDYVADILIDDAPTIDVGWIPCSERLPKEYAQYLVCFEDGECYVYRLEDSDWARGMVEKEGIIAWMPLPMPYREDGEA